MKEKLKCEHCGLISKSVREDRYDNILCPACTEQAVYDVEDSDYDADFERDENK